MMRLRQVVKTFGWSRTLVLVGLALAVGAGAAQADIIKRYQHCNDEIRGAQPVGDGIHHFIKAAFVGSATASIPFTIDLSAWDLDNNGSEVVHTNLHLGFLMNNNSVVYRPNLFGVTRRERWITISDSTPLGCVSVGLYCTKPDPANNGVPTNTFIRVRNFRVAYGTPSSPTVTYTRPTNGTAVRSWPSVIENGVSKPGIEGTATPVSPAFVTAVNLTIRRNSDSLYWNGTGWDWPFTPLAATYDAGTRRWVMTNVPLGTNLPDGSYTIMATADDSSSRCTSNEITITVDTVPPLIATMTWPVPGSTIDSLSQIRGTAYDNSGGSGINRVMIRITREVSPLQHWNGSSWVSTWTSLGTVLTGNNWSAPTTSYTLPSGNLLYEGRYSVRIYPYDRAGNFSSALSYFFVDKPSP